MTRPRWRLGRAVILVAVFVAACGGRAARPAPATVTPPPTPRPGPLPSPDRPPPVVEEGAPPAVAPSGASYLPLVAQNDVDCAYGTAQTGGVLTGQPAVWQPLTLTFTGPAVAATAAVNPFLDYRLTVQFIAPSGRVSDVPGYFGGGAAWQAHFAADEPGMWRYCASFRLGPAVAVSDDPLAGAPIAFDGAEGAFTVAPADPAAPDFFRWGRLEYAGGHYLKFRDGPYWLKGGTNSPENFLGYAGFANTVDQGGLVDGFLHQYAAHAADARPDDPTFGAPGDAAGIIGALNYLGQRHVNSIYFLPMNLGGDGDDSYPYLSPDDPTRFDTAKLAQWGVVLEHAQRQGIALHVVLNEVEEANRRRLDDGALGVQRRLFYREMVARFAHLPAIKWNLSEEAAFPPADLRAFAAYLAALDWAGHPITAHNAVGAADALYSGLLGDPLFSATALQYAAEEAGALAETWRERSAAAGRPWVVDLDENNPAGVGLTPDNAGQLRKAILYDAYLSGAAGVEWYLGYHALPTGGDPNLEDFRTREAMWDYMWYARRLLAGLPFAAMTPADDLLSGEPAAFGGGEVLALDGQVYAVYLPEAQPAGVLAVPAGAYRQQWYDPRTGEFAAAVAVTATGGRLPLGAPPHTPSGDWVVLLTAEGVATPTPTPPAYP